MIMNRSIKYSKGYFMEMRSKDIKVVLSGVFSKTGIYILQMPAKSGFWFVVTDIVQKIEGWKEYQGGKTYE